MWIILYSSPCDGPVDYSDVSSQDYSYREASADRKDTATLLYTPDALIIKSSEIDLVQYSAATFILSSKLACSLGRIAMVWG